jgi:DNA-binding NtrC family response regulator
LPYNVIIIDDSTGPASWGANTKANLEDYEFAVTHASTIHEANNEIARLSYDIIIVDLALQSPTNGIEFFNDLRNRGLTQPIILVSGASDYLIRPISDYADALASGPVSFYDKRSSKDFVQVVREVSSRVDPIRRVLRLMKDAGLGEKTFTVQERVYTVAELLQSSPTSDELVRALRESLYALVLELQARAGKTE